MRWLRWLVLAAIPLFAGCLDDPRFGPVAMDCSDDSQVIVGAHREILYPSSAPDEVRVTNSRAVATVTARDGQTLVAQVTYSVAYGEVNVLLDAPHENQAQTQGTWSSQGEVSAGDYTLELEGSPFAFEVQYTIVLVAYGCTPA